MIQVKEPIFENTGPLPSPTETQSKEAWGFLWKEGRLLERPFLIIGFDWDCVRGEYLAQILTSGDAGMRTFEIPLEYLKDKLNKE